MVAKVKKTSNYREKKDTVLSVFCNQALRLLAPPGVLFNIV